MTRDRDSITDWALHPGGRGILDKLELTLGLPPEALRESRDVLATRGNMSSVTVLHVLRQVIDEAPADERRECQDPKDSCQLSASLATLS